MTSLPLILLVLLPFAGALVSACFPNRSRNRPAIAAGVFTLAALIIAISKFDELGAGQVVLERYEWLPLFGLDKRQVRIFAAFVGGAFGSGLRPQYHANYYAAFVIGPDGHNIEAVCSEPEA